MFITLSLVLLCFMLYMLTKEDPNYWRKKGVIFEKPLPFVGNIMDVILLRKSLFNKISDLYFKFDEPYFGIWVFNRPQLVLKCPDLIKQVLIKDFNYFYDRFLSCDEDIDDFSANMMFFMKNPKWKFIRSKTTHMFSPNKIKNSYSGMQFIAKNMIAFIDNRTNEKAVEINNISAKYTAEAACSIGFGVDVNNFQNKDTRFVSIGKSTCTITLLNVISVISYYCKSSLVNIFKLKMVDSSDIKFLKDFLLDTIEKRKSENSQRNDVINFLINFKKESNLRDTEILAQAAQFFVAGYETTNSTISLALYELSLNKSIQNKLRQEILENLDVQGDVSYSSLNNMDYLDKIINETLRKYPVVPFIGRSCAQDYKIPNTAVVIEKGVEVIISLTGLHNDPKYYPVPELFDPERFSSENIRERHPCTYLPFGEGQRNCIGQRLAMILVKLAVAHVIKNFEIEISEETNMPLLFNPRTFIMSANNGIYVKFRKLD